LTRWDDSKLLTVVVDRLERWSAPGVLCIGDAAHAMSPIGGVGINLAIQDAIAAANRLAPALCAHRVTTDDLAAVQARREPAVRKIQALQVAIQDRMLAQALAGRTGAALRIAARAPPPLPRCGAPWPADWRSASLPVPPMRWRATCTRKAPADPRGGEDRPPEPVGCTPGRSGAPLTPRDGPPWTFGWIRTPTCTSSWKPSRGMAIWSVVAASLSTAMRSALPVQ